MTERAGTYYTDEAQKLGVPAPAIFNGAPLALMAEGQVLSTLAPGDIGQQLTQEFKAVVSSVVPFISARTDAMPVYYDRTITASSERNVASITGAMLLPRSIRGGRISGLSVEAIAPDELVLPGMFAAFGPAANNPAIRDPAVRRVFMVVSGMLEERKYATKPCAGMVGVYLNTQNHTRKSTPHFTTGVLSQAIARDWYEARH